VEEEGRDPRGKSNTGRWGPHRGRKRRISIHPVVLGELATGNLTQRTQTLGWLRTLPGVRAGTPDECLAFIEAHALHGCGIGWNDVQLLAAARLSGHALWSLDTRLATAAIRLGVAYPASARFMN